MQQIYLPPLTKTNKILLIILVGSFILSSMVKAIFGVELVGLLGLSLVGLKSGMVFQFLTFPLISTGLMEVVFTGLLLWFLGSELESMWGVKRYVAYLILTALISGFVYIGVSAVIGGAIAGYPFHGMGIFASAMCVSYAVVYPDRTFQFFMLIPMKAKWFCLILAAMTLYTGVFTPGGAQAWGQLMAMGFGFIYIRMLLMPWYNKFFIKSSMKSSTKSKKSHLRIVKDDEQGGDGPRYWQ